MKVLHSICQQIWKIQQWPQDWKRSVFISVPVKSNDKECSNYCTIALVSHKMILNKVMLKILKARLQNMWTMNFQMFKLVLEKAEGPEVKWPTYPGSLKKHEKSRKTSVSALLTMPKCQELIWEIPPMTRSWGKTWNARLFRLKGTLQVDPSLYPTLYPPPLAVVLVCPVVDLCVACWELSCSSFTK